MWTYVSARCCLSQAWRLPISSSDTSASIKIKYKIWYAAMIMSFSFSEKLIFSRLYAKLEINAAIYEILT